MDGRSAFSVLRSSAPFGLHATRTYTEGPRSERSTPHASTPIEPPFSATPGHITASYHTKASGLVLVPWHDTPPLRSSVPRVNHKHAHLTQAQCRPRLEEISRNRSISRQVCNVTPGAK